MINERQISLGRNIRHVDKLPYKDFACVVDMIRTNDELKENTKSVRMFIPKGKKMFDEAKADLPYAIFSGQFSKRGNKFMETPSFLISIDLDDIKQEDIDKVLSDPMDSVALIYVSPSTIGLKIIHLYEQVADHYSAWTHFKNVYFEKYKLSIDEKCSDIARASFLAYDPKAYVNFNPKKEENIKIIKKESTGLIDPTTSLDTHYDYENKLTTGNKEVVTKMILSYLTRTGLSITKDYQRWVNLAFILYREFGARGQAMFHEFSKLDVNVYTEANTDKKWIQGSTAPSQTPVTFASLVYYAMDVNFVFPARTSENIKIGFKKDYWMQIMENEWPLIRYNVMRNQFESLYKNNWIEFTKKKYDELAQKLNVTAFNQYESFLSAVVPEVDMTEKFLAEIPKWDKKDRMIPLRDTLQSEDPEITLLYLKKWLVGAVATWDKNHKYQGSSEYSVNDSVLILQGDNQGGGKTRWMKKLLPDRWQSYLLDKNLEVSNKDDAFALTENLINLNDEFDNIVKFPHLIDAFKAMTSRKTYRDRLPYAKQKCERRKTASICATLNQREYLRDTTGNRRFWNISVDQVDYTHKINIMQVWAQAKHLLYKENFKYYLEREKDELMLNERHNKKYDIIRSENELIYKYMKLGDDELMTTTDIIHSLNDFEDRRAVTCTPNQMGKYLKQEGFSYGKDRSRRYKFSFRTHKTELKAKKQADNLLFAGIRTN